MGHFKIVINLSKVKLKEGLENNRNKYIWKLQKLREYKHS